MAILIIISIIVFQSPIIVFAQMAQTEDEEMIIRNRWSEIKSSIIEVPFEEILEEGETLITDGSANYIPRLEQLMAKANEAYLDDGKMRVIKFPVGTFNFPIDNPTAKCVSGVGFRGAGKIDNGDGTYTYLTKLTPTQTILGTNPDYNTTQVHEDIIIDCLEIDCSGQEVIESISKFWYVYKAIYVERVDNWWMNDVYAHDSLGTLFGLDYIYSEGVYHIDCRAVNSGRAGTADVSGPGAGFGITSGRSASEPCKFVGCIAENCKTGGYYFEIRSNKVDLPVGYSILNCKAFDCSFGVDDQGVDDLIIENSSFYRNSSYGIRRGGTTSGAGSNAFPGDMYCKNTKIYSNGSVSNVAIRSAGVGFTERLQEIDKNDHCEQVFENCEIYNNRGYGISNTYSVPRYLKLKGSTKIYNNGGSGIHIREGKDNTEILTLTTEGDNVEIYNNGICADTALYATENGSATGVYGDAVTLSVNSNNNNMKFKAYGNKSRVIAFREYMGNDN
ncbi:MAG: right-handed parallel beta-helix repeat-containing protein, partial [Eubacteriales bacterium]|nr:right-handed parallel beta-helix repeat-containing protein [Eubacteriales bacterium]